MTGGIVRGGGGMTGGKYPDTIMDIYVLLFCYSITPQIKKNYLKTIYLGDPRFCFEAPVILVLELLGLGR